MQHLSRSRAGRRQVRRPEQSFRIACVVVACMIAPIAHAQGEQASQPRFALSTARIDIAQTTHVGESVASATAHRVEATTKVGAARAFRLDGAVIAGSDTIFANGFDPHGAWDVTLAGNVPIGWETVQLGSVTLPPGAYLAMARLQIRTGSEQNPGNSYRLDCTLRIGQNNADTSVYRVGTQSDAERYLTFQGVGTLAASGSAYLACRDGNGHVDTALGGKLTVLAVDAVE